MNRYELKNPLGDGTYGSVMKAIKKGTREVVAIKKMKKKYSSFEECLDLREVKTLRNLNHPHIVRLLEVIRENDSTLCFVFEHMDANLYEVMKQYQNSFNLQAMSGGTAAGFPVTATTGLTIIPVSKIQSILYQVLQALAFMHSKGYFHRDIKPENLLMKGDIIKVADLGLAREILSLPPYTDYVSTRWYRAPEVLLRSPHYNSPIDIFAVGCILAELFSLQPLFPGSSELDQISRICGLLGGPNPLEWPEGAALVNTLNIRIGYQHVPTVSQAVLHASTSLDSRLVQQIPQMSQYPIAVDFLKGLLVLNPKHRLTAKDSLNHAFFKVPENMMEQQRSTANNRNALNLGLVNHSVASVTNQSLATLGLNQIAAAHHLQQAAQQQIQQQQAQAQAQAQQDIAVALLANSMQHQQQHHHQQQQQHHHHQVPYHLEQQQQHHQSQQQHSLTSVFEQQLAQLDNCNNNNLLHQNSTRHYLQQPQQQLADDNNLSYRLSHNDLSLSAVAAAGLAQQQQQQQGSQHSGNQNGLRSDVQAPWQQQYNSNEDTHHQLQLLQHTLNGELFNSCQQHSNLNAAASNAVRHSNLQSYGPVSASAIAQLALHQATTYGSGEMSPKGFGTQKY